VNILPMILSLLIVLSLLSSSFTKRHGNFAIETKTYSAFMEAERGARNALAHALYKDIKMPTTNNTPSEKKRGRNKIHRDKHPHSPLAIGNMNLARETAEALFIRLYGKQPFFTKKLMKQFLQNDLIGKTCYDIIPKKNPEPFLKVLRGTSTYDIEKGEGYPPFEEFFSFDERKPVLFKSAHPVILEVVFGKEKADAIIHAEKTGADPVPLGKEHTNIIELSGKYPTAKGVRKSVRGMSVKKSLKLE